MNCKLALYVVLIYVFNVQMSPGSNFSVSLQCGFILLPPCAKIRAEAPNTLALCLFVCLSQALFIHLKVIRNSVYVKHNLHQCAFYHMYVCGLFYCLDHLVVGWTQGLGFLCIIFGPEHNTNQGTNCTLWQFVPHMSGVIYKGSGSISEYYEGNDMRRMFASSTGLVLKLMLETVSQVACGMEAKSMHLKVQPDS